jgi:hypothetical protein
MHISIGIRRMKIGMIQIPEGSGVTDTYGYIPLTQRHMIK